MKLLPDMPLRVFLRTIVPALLALIVLNIGLAHHNIWPTLWIRTTTEVSLELVVLITGIAFFAAGGMRAGRRTQWALSVLLLVYVGARYIDVTAPALFGRRIDLYWDTQHIPALAAMATENWSLLSIVLLLAAVAAVFAALLVLIRISLGAVCRAMDHAVFRKSVIGTGALLLAMYGAGMNSNALNWERKFAIPITPVYVDQASAIIAHLSGSADEARPAPIPLRPYAELSGRDVFVVFLESYGRVALDDEAYSSATRAALADIDAKLSAEGWQARSAYLTAPTVGGASWLSHSSLLAGYTIDNHDLYEAFLQSDDETLVDRFRKAGYRSILLTPGIRGPWPAGRALRFDRIAAAADVAYDGQGFGWWYVPDQYSLDWLSRAEISNPERAPIFAMFPTIMSHFPFGPAPPYLEDWDRLTETNPYDENDVAQTVALGDAFSGDPKDAYLRVMLYNLSMVEGFVSERTPEDAIVVAIGDHQPPAAISGEDAAWDIPIHVFARDAALLSAFERKGFIAGTIPEGESVGRTDEVASLILEALEKPVPARHIAGVE
jgi:hypothetical protein